LLTLDVERTLVILDHHAEACEEIVNEVLKHSVEVVDLVELHEVADSVEGSAVEAVATHPATNIRLGKLHQRLMTREISLLLGKFSLQTSLKSTSNPSQNSKSSYKYASSQLNYFRAKYSQLMEA
jgi:hypothetical protein